MVVVVVMMVMVMMMMMVVMIIRVVILRHLRVLFRSLNFIHGPEKRQRVGNRFQQLCE